MGASTPPERSSEAPTRASARPRHYVARLTEAVHRASLRHAVFGALAAVLVLVAGAFLVLTLSNRGSLQNTTRDGHSDEVLQNSNTDERMVIDLETGLRGYLLTNQRLFLEPYFQARVGLAAQLPRLEQLAGENPAQ